MPGIFRIGRCEVRSVERRLFVDGKPASLGARAFDLLLALIERHDRVVSKNELLDVVWPGLVVEENNLQVQVSALRKLLGPQAIATIPGRGYRFTLPVDGPGTGRPGRGPPPGNAVESPARSRRRTNLPSQLPPLYGRQSDLAQVRALLASYRVVSIVGPAGIGKTRLAQAIAIELRNGFTDGVWWVELAQLSSPELVAAEVARVLQVPLPADRPALEAIASVLRSQLLLLLLDNCEHLLEAVAALIETICRAAPNVRVLVTSQVLLRTAEEHAYRLNTLAVPASSALDDVHASGAAQLFVERAKAADPRIALTMDNAGVVAEICRRLDGIALALELAAARVPLLGLEGLRARLDERFHILTGGSKFVLLRYQTLHAALDFSHGLLSPDEQAIFRRCGVFAGSFAAETAQDVAADDRIDAWAVLDHLGALVDKSMIVAEGGSLPRLRLLETTRAYALEKLADVSETHRMLERHARAMARLFAGMYHEFLHQSDEAWLSRYECELDNLRAALAWSLQHDTELAIVLAGDSRPLWLELGLQPEALRLCEAALARVDSTTPARAAGRLWYSLAGMWGNANPARARDAAERAVQILRGADDPATLAPALAMLAAWSSTLSDPKGAAAIEELQRLDDSRWPPRLRLLLPNVSAFVHRAAGRFVEAKGCYELTRDRAASFGATQFELTAQSNIGDIALTMGDLDLALSTYREVARRLAPLRDKFFYTFTLGNLALALLLKFDPIAAREVLAQAAPLIVRYDVGYHFALTAALLAAHERRWSAAAQLLGYRDAESVRRGALSDEPTEFRAREETLQRLAAHERPDEIEAWRRQGASLTVDDAYRLALAAPQD